jgi:hypothetical protein
MLVEVRQLYDLISESISNVYSISRDRSTLTYKKVCGCRPLLALSTKQKLIQSPFFIYLDAHSTAQKYNNNECGLR